MMVVMTRHPETVLLVAGFTQTPSSWDGVRAELAPDVNARALTIPMRPSFTATAAALADEGSRGVWVGYSMGGRLALRLALDRPEAVAHLVLVSATPGIESADERARRVAADETRAQEIERDGVESFLERWLDEPLFAGVPHDAPGLAERKLLPSATLAHQLRVLGTGRMQPVWDRLHELTMPITIVTGAADTKFDAIGARMAGSMADARHVRVGGGHAVPLESPAELARAIRAAQDAG